MKKLSLILAIIILCFSNTSFGQLVGTQGFLQGRWLEIGEIGNGAFGAFPAPAGYHPNCPFCGINVLSEVYDWGHDGWAVGTPAYMGDYTYPGAPEEGWAIQANGLYDMMYVSGGFSGTASGTGSILSYSNSGGDKRTFWQGSILGGGGLTIRQETRVDTQASWVVVTTYLQNITASPITGVYYMRTCDPDNATQWGGSYQTANDIVYQNDWDHRVMVSAYDPVLGPTKSYLALGTKDCRAKAFIMNGGLIPFLSGGFKIDNIYNGTGGASGYTYIGSYSSCFGGGCDVGIGLAYNLGTIAPNDSAIISYAYIFNGNTGIDSAFPDPVLSVNHGSLVSYPRIPYNLPLDTFDACMYPGLDSIPLDIPWADDKDWSWSSWTWSPGTGLSATTGTHVWAYITSIPGAVTYTITGVDSNSHMYSCGNKIFLLTIKSCHKAWNNSPCYGDTLQFRESGDSVGATYFWYNKITGFTSTLHNPFIYPAVYADTGVYYVIKTIGGIADTDSTVVYIRTKPKIIVSDNSPMCEGAQDTLKLSVTPYITGETFAWTGPFGSGFTSSLEFPTIPGFAPTQTGIYTVVATTTFGCKDTGTVPAVLIPVPKPPVINGKPTYCQGDPFVPFSATFTPPGTLQWYTQPIGGTPSTTPPNINTSVPGRIKVYASVISGSCESARAEFSVTVTTTPAAPIASGRTEYCQFVGTFEPLLLTRATPFEKAQWYTASTGGSPLATEPIVDLSVSGNHNYWVSYLDSGCESPRTPVVIIVHPKPNPPVPVPGWVCQFVPYGPVKATPSATGDIIQWFAHPGDATGSTTAPTPQTLVPGRDSFYLNETSTYGCVSNMTWDTIEVRVKPSIPITRDTTYCQWTLGAPLNAQVDSLDFTHLEWHSSNGAVLPGAPVPHNTLPGDSTWRVLQILDQCPSDDAPVTVTTIYKPSFTISATSPFVCQFDSVHFAYNGPALKDPSYVWSLPAGASYARTADGRSLPTDSLVYVRFDSVVENNFVYLHVSDNNGFCSGDTSLRIKIVPQPLGRAHTKADVCQGDTVVLALGDKSSSASSFKWTVDGIPMDRTTALTIVAHNNNSGGPFGISWNDTGRHVVQVFSSTEEGCKSLPTDDSVNVHATPLALFTYATKNGAQQVCLEDSVQFFSATTDYRNTYVWTPDHFFVNNNKPVIWGKMEQSRSIVTLTVTNPFGCYASTSQELDPSSCCTVTFPTGFTPAGIQNKLFKPLYAGFHRFHEFRVANRWGQTVFQSTNNNMTWDGNYNGVPQDMGVYFYYIKFDCGGKTIEQTGDVTLIR